MAASRQHPFLNLAAACEKIRREASDLADKHYHGINIYRQTGHLLHDMSESPVRYPSWMYRLSDIITLIPKYTNDQMAKIISSFPVWLKISMRVQDHGVEYVCRAVESFATYSNTHDIVFDPSGKIIDYSLDHHSSDGEAWYNPMRML